MIALHILGWLMAAAIPGFFAFLAWVTWRDEKVAGVFFSLVAVALVAVIAVP